MTAILMPEIQVNMLPATRTSLFLKGPIPLDWLERAARLPGKALHVGISLWFLCGVTKKRTVRFNQSQQGRYGVGRDSARRAINSLENAGLIVANRKSGRCLEVTIENAASVLEAFGAGGHL